MTRKPLSPNEVLKTLDVSHLVEAVNTKLNTQEWYRHDFDGKKSFKIQMKASFEERQALCIAFKGVGWTNVETKPTLHSDEYWIEFSLANWTQPPKEE